MQKSEKEVENLKNDLKTLNHSTIEEGSTRDIFELSKIVQEVTRQWWRRCSGTVCCKDMSSASRVVGSSLRSTYVTACDVEKSSASAASDNAVAGELELLMTSFSWDDRASRCISQKLTSQLHLQPPLMMLLLKRLLLVDDYSDISVCRPVHSAKWGRNGTWQSKVVEVVGLSDDVFQI